MPSGEVMTSLTELVAETATRRLSCGLHAMENQKLSAAPACGVQSIPSGEVITSLEFEAETATKRPSEGLHTIAS
jgi:hypothetical protein